MFTNLNEALNWLYEQKKSKKREDLSRISYLIKKLIKPSLYEEKRKNKQIVPSDYL